MYDIEGNCPTLFGTGEASAEVLCPILGRRTELPLHS